MLIKIILTLVLTLNIYGASLDNIKTYDWNGIEVVHLVDNRFPTYDLAFYFADGALSDQSNKGITDGVLSWLPLGTRRYGQKEIADNLEFFAATHSSQVNHEYSLYSVSGLVKDIKPTVKMICHLFNDASFPKKELKKEKRRLRQSILEMVNSKGALATMISRELSLKGSPFSYPVGGKLKDIKKMTQARLQSHLKYFNESVKKKIYISGPEASTSIKDVISKDCGWSGKATFVRKLKKPVKMSTPKIYLVTVPKANQAQVRIGRLLEKDEGISEYQLDLASGFLGGGFTSRLMRVLRNDHGLIYGGGAYASMQSEYGRSGISTATANKNLTKLLKLTKKSIEDISNGEIPDDEFSRSKGLLAAGFPFRFERSSVLLGQLIALDHLGKGYDSLFDYPDQIYALKKDDLQKAMRKIFSWDQQVIVIVGTKSLKKQLRKFGKVTTISYKKFL